MKRLLCFYMLVACLLGVYSQHQMPFVDAASGLCFELLADGRGARLTHPQREWPYYGAVKPQGTVTVPAEVVWQGQHYAVVEVGQCAFYGCDGLTEVALPASCQRIGAQAFAGCTALRRCVMAEGLCELSDGVFAYCASLVAVALPASVERVGLSAFAQCKSLQRVEMTEQAWRTCNGLTFLGCPLIGDGKNRANSRQGSVVLQKNAP